jgi:hypothetical protein
MVYFWNSAGQERDTLEAAQRSWSNPISIYHSLAVSQEAIPAIAEIELSFRWGASRVILGWSASANATVGSWFLSQMNSGILRYTEWNRAIVLTPQQQRC